MFGGGGGVFGGVYGGGGREIGVRGRYEIIHIQVHT